ncbi:MAG: amidohydrolase family protein [Pseudobutyrivibrio sp.]|nr:amidohydrolase family protein [Pseudobutyrivibrio sp.]
MYDIGIVNGELYIDGDFEKKNLYIKGESIAEITSEMKEATRIIDASNLKVLPGFIDPHVHFHLGVGENISKDDFEDGSKEAVLGGVTTYIDFLDPIKRASEIKEEFKKRSFMAKDSLVDYAFHTTIANPSSGPREIFEESLKAGINSVKLFTTYSDTDRRTYEDYIYRLLGASKEYKCRVIVHAEKDDLIDKSKEIPVKNHSKSRPVACEYEEVMELAQMTKAMGGNLYIVHTNCGSTVVAIRHEYGSELAHGNIVLESCPHYFLFNDQALSKPDGYKYTMTPPLRPENERCLMVDNIDAFATIGTDHCPYTREQKQHEYTSQIPMGVGGIRYSFLSMYNLFGYSILDKYTVGPAKIYGLSKKGTLALGMDADIVLFDERGTTKVDDDMSIYFEKEFRGVIKTVINRGAVVNDSGKIMNHQGKYIYRKELGDY